MADKQIKVVIDGEETLTPVTKKAGDAVEGFSERTSNLLKGLAALAGTLALGAFFRKAVEEAENSREAMGQLALAVNNSGESFKDMTPRIDGALDKLSRMTKFGDDDFARAMQQMTLKTGDAKWALSNLGQAADLAAAANVPLEQAADALAKAHEGNTKALFKMVPELKNASDWQGMLADKTRGAAEAQMQQLGPFEAIKKQFGEFAESVGRAILGNEDMSKSGFGVAEMLADMGKWIDSNVDKFKPFFAAVSSIVDNLSKSLAPALSLIGPAAKAAFSLLVDAVQFGSVGIRAYVIYAQDTIGKFYSWLAEKGIQMAGVFKKFGIDIGTDGLKQLKDWGESQKKQAAENWTQLQADDAAYKARDKQAAVKHQDDLTGATKQGTTDRRKTEDDSAEEQARADKKWYEERKAQLQALWKAIDLIAVGAAETAKTLGPAVKTAFDQQTINNHVDALEAARKKNAELIKQFTDANQLPKAGPTFDEIKEAVGKFAVKTGDTIQTVGDLAKSFGVVDDKTQAALGSAGRLVEKIGELMKPGASWSLGGTLGIIGAVGSLVTTMMAMGQNDAERRRLLAENNKKLEELNKTYGDLSIKQSGNAMVKLQAAFGDLNAFAELSKQNGNPLSPDMLRSVLDSWHLTDQDLDNMAKYLGLNIRDKKGNLVWEAVLQLSQQVANLKPTISQSFREQLDFFKTSQDLSGASALDKLRGVAEFVGSRSPGLKGLFDPNDLAGSFSRLFALRTTLNNPGAVNYKDFGQLTGDEFRSVVEELLNGIKALQESGGLTGGGSGGSSSGGAVSDITGGTTTGTGKTLADVVTTITAQTDALSEYHSTHLSIAKDHLEEARLQTDILTEIAKNTAATAAMGIDAAFGKQLAVERRLAGTPAL